MKDLHYVKEVKSIWRKIADAYTDGVAIGWTVMISYAIILWFLLTICNDKTTPKDIEGKTIYRHVVLVERYNGLKDTIIYHDVNKEVDVDSSSPLVSDKDVTIITLGKNGYGFNFNSNIKIDNAIGFKVIE